MRIISGAARGRKLAALPSKDSSIRPTADRAREALFSILGSRVLDAQVLDLFAGTGSVGLEAYSRGAQHVVFVDNGNTALRLLKKNLTIFPSIDSGANNLTVLKDDLRRPNFAKRLSRKNSRKFDIIFADPPYGKDLAMSVIEYICKNKLLTARGIVVIEERHNITLPDTLIDLQLTDRRTYGEASFSFFMPTDNETQSDV